MAFHVGQAVVCVDATHDNWSRKWLVEGQTYTVANLLPPTDDFLNDHLCSPYGVELREVPGKPNGFGALRFRPKTDIGVFHEILRKVTKRQGADA